MTTDIQNKAKFIDKTTGEEKYSDGDMVENKLLEILKSENKQELINELLKNNPSWAELYHLTPIRENLLNWYPFEKNKTLLEVGAGFGAVTGVFCRKLEKVTSIELTKRRALATFHRHFDCGNLTVIAGNIHDVEANEKFDYITSIGVLEYAALYTESDNPYEDFLKKINTFLKPQGSIIIAIENKFGLKYWAGAKEDHTGRYFDSLEGYLETKVIQTFGRKEIIDLLTHSGYEDIKFYYPVPDYKLPMEVFSDEYLPSLDHNIRSQMVPFADRANSREYVFNEKAVSDNIVENDAFPFFSNSFLIFAKKSDQ